MKRFSFFEKALCLLSTRIELCNIHNWMTPVLEEWKFNFCEERTKKNAVCSINESPYCTYYYVMHYYRSNGVRERGREREREIAFIFSSVHCDSESERWSGGGRDKWASGIKGRQLRKFNKRKTSFDNCTRIQHKKPLEPFFIYWIQIYSPALFPYLPLGVAFYCANPYLAQFTVCYELSVSFWLLSFLLKHFVWLCNYITDAIKGRKEMREPQKSEKSRTLN